MKKLDKSYVGWNTDNHSQNFDSVWNKKFEFEFNFIYGNFAEHRYLLNYLNKNKGKTILDVGCATATTYRYLKNNLAIKDFDYLGVDLSLPALKIAKALYPNINVIHKGKEKLSTIFDKKFDIVYSRDTVMHQTDPYKFLNELIDSANDILILRLRTRDVGITEFNFHKSCQLHYDQFWMPYIVLNFDELIFFLKKNKRIKKIKFNKEYNVLGGSHMRFIPKDLFYKKTGTAETSLMIELSNDDDSNLEIIEDHMSQGHQYIKNKSIINLCFKIIHKLFRR